MLQHYKLRLSDGTVLLVDQEGLSAWLEDAKAMVQATGSSQWRPLREMVWELRASTTRTAQQEGKAWAALPLIPPPPRVREEATLTPPPLPVLPLDPVPPLPVLLLDPVPPLHAVVRQPPPSEPAATPAVEAPPDAAMAIPSRPLDDEEPALHPAASAWRDSLAPGPFGTGATVQVLADEPVAEPAAESRETPAFDALGPVIRLKPLDDDEVPAYTVAGPGYGERDAVEVDDEDGEGSRQDRLDGPLLSALSALGSFLSVWLARLERLGRRAPSRSHEAQRWRAVASTLKAPPPISELPVLRFADTHEPEEAADLFEGEDSDAFFYAAWLWTKRVVLLAGLVAGGVYASLTWEAWFPKAADLGQQMFARIDTLVRSGDQAERQQRALLAATAQLPHLSPQTVRLVLAASPTGALEPPEVFRLAWDAASRGLGALAPGESEELRSLRGQILDRLRPTERERILEYDRVRAHRATFAFEDRHVLDLFAGAARGLPPPGLERLQDLLGTTVAAGLVPPGPEPARPVAQPVAAVSPTSPAAPPPAVNFVRDVRPILEARCQPCHFPAGKMYDRLPFDQAQTIRDLGPKLFTRIKTPEEQATIRQFLAQEP